MKPLDYLSTTEGLIWTGVCAALGALFTALVFFIINHIPAKWLCDYNEEPSEELLSGRRIKFLPAAPLLFVLFTAVLLLCRVQFNRGFDPVFIMASLVVLCCALVAVSDIKYQIIPDQFTIALAVLSALLSVYDIISGYGFFSRAWWSPLAGAAIGAGVMIVIDLIGQLVYHREGMGFGDVKLFAAVGLLSGFPGTIYVLIIAILTATLGFLAVIIIKAVRSPKAEQTEKAEETPSEAQPSDEKTDPDEEASPEDSKNDEAAAEAAESGAGGYLAFGPYIALALAAYLAFYDRINELVNMYLNLFK